MRKFLLITAIALAYIFALNIASATQLYFDPMDLSYNIGDTLYYDLYADIDAGDSIMGFGFDLSFDSGVTFISAPGDSGSYLTFNGFTGNSELFYYEPLFDDGDTISGWRAFLDSSLSGTGIRLGTFWFTAYAPALGAEIISLDADDLGPFGTEGLVQDKLGGVAFIPNIPSASASPAAIPIPEPENLPFIGFVLIGGLAGLNKRFGKIKEI